MKIFICEFITCGGLVDQELSVSLSREGSMMLQSLIEDVQKLNQHDIFFTLDHRIVNIFAVKESEVIYEQKHRLQIWQKYFQQCDCCIIVAPETNGILLDLIKQANECECVVLGCKKEAVQICSSKHTVYELLHNKIDQPLTYSNIQYLENSTSQNFIMKPDDGVGSENCYRISSKSDYEYFSKLNSHIKSWVIQEYLVGKVGSITVFFDIDECYLLAINKIHMNIHDNAMVLSEIVVNGLLEYKNQAIELVAIISENISGFYGFVGIDFIIQKEKMYLLEINPRITTAYSGLHNSLEINPMLLFNTFNHADIKMTDAFANKPVRVTI